MNNRPTDVVMLSFGGTSDGKQKTSFQRKRETIWENVERNRFVSEIAQLLIKDPFRFLQKLGVNRSEVQDLVRCKNRRIVVLAETVDHARALNNFLPKWQMLDALTCVTEEEAWLPPQKNKKNKSGLIATLMYAYRYRISCDILIRITAGTGRLDWFPLSQLSLLDDKPALIVDVADMNHPKNKRDVKVRLSEYAQQKLRVKSINAPSAIC